MNMQFETKIEKHQVRPASARSIEIDDQLIQRVSFARCLKENPPKKFYYLGGLLAED